MKQYIAMSLITLLLVACGGGSNTPKTVIPDIQLTTTEAFNEVLNQHVVPAIGGAYIEGDQIKENFVLGLRVQGSVEPLALADRWHLGSITKSFTSTLAAKLIELSYLEWNTKISEVFDINEYDSKYANVTLEQLLSHTGGIHADIRDVSGWLDYFTSTEDLLLQRTMMANDLMHMSGNTIGVHEYSNGSFVIAGAMLERIMGDSWEILLTDFVLTPLNIFDVQFGAPTDGWDNSQPYGHELLNGGWSPMSPDNAFSDNPKAMGPAGTLSMSLDSLSQYLIAHMIGKSGQSTLLEQSSFEKLHRKVSGTDYAMGWYVDGSNIYHPGSNTFWYAHIGIDFGSKTVGVIALTNVGGDRGIAVTDNIIDVLLDRNY